VPRSAAVLTIAIALTLITSGACARGNEERPLDTLAVAAESGQAAAGRDTSAAAIGDTLARPPSSGDRVLPRPPAGGTSPPQRPTPRAPSTTSPPPGASTSGGADTARGIVAVVGAVPITEVVLRSAGSPSITLTGPLAREIRVASGADVWVRGRRTDARTIEVASYAVRSVDGVTAITGTLRREGDRLVLVTDEGQRHPIARPPAPLGEHVGARVWISGDPSATINAYGVLRRP
jgi:hypothetical protein